MKNQQNFNFWSEANHARNLIVPEFASKADIHKCKDCGYWLNVWWKCGIIAPLTIQEMIQAEEDNNVETSRIP